MKRLFDMPRKPNTRLLAGLTSRAHNRRTHGPITTGRRYGEDSYVVPPLGSLIQGAGTAMPSRASADLAASMADGRSCDAHAVDSCSAHAASDGNLCHDTVWQSERRGCHALRRCRNGQGEAGNSDQPQHYFLPCSCCTAGKAAGTKMPRCFDRRNVAFRPGRT